METLIPLSEPHEGLFEGRTGVVRTNAYRGNVIGALPWERSSPGIELGKSVLTRLLEYAHEMLESVLPYTEFKLVHEIRGQYLVDIKPQMSQFA